ncbi:MAG TPA: 3-dehydroquinate synthase [Vicinamibacterales bacterium]|jgi:3-dehydroquinate synthase
MHPVRIDVTTASGAYAVLVGPGLASQIGSLLDERRIGRRRFVVTNPLVWRLHGEPIAAALPGAEVIQIPDGERHKHLQTVGRVYDLLVKAQADRGSVIVTVGGGVIGDLAGFVAATFMRGIGLVHVPTTLLAQVDASIGGKVGVNLAAGKNLVGAFYPPLLVVADPRFLGTLPRREFRAGMYEVVKYGMACSETLFTRLQRDRRSLRDAASETLGPLVAECGSIKAAIVSADERESGLRRVLNFGHTAGHAIESVTGYRRFRHGEAVAWGMLVAADVAVARALLADDERAQLSTLIMQLGPLPQVTDLAIGDILDAMQRDKKVTDGALHFVLPTGIGRASVVTDVRVEELTAALRRVGFRA